MVLPEEAVDDERQDLVGVAHDIEGGSGDVVEAKETEEGDRRAPDAGEKEKPERDRRKATVVVDLGDSGVLAEDEHAREEDHERHQVVVVRTPPRGHLLVRAHDELGDDRVGGVDDPVRDRPEQVANLEALVGHDVSDGSSDNQHQRGHCWHRQRLCLEQPDVAICRHEDRQRPEHNHRLDVSRGKGLGVGEEEAHECHGVPEERARRRNLERVHLNDVELAEHPQDQRRRSHLEDEDGGRDREVLQHRLVQHQHRR
mmetsp:Transcript_59077/g.140534  ORF Transcript_59077/g.140534 Transcript_59077/m.140534 type:complete len:257 (-) Transcript_59077:359-1129(-)